MQGSMASQASARETLERISHYLVFDALLWDRDSHGLFDYDSKGLVDNKLSANGCFLLVRDESTLKTVMPKLGCPDSYKELLSTVYKNGAYWVYHSKSLYQAENGELDEKYSHFDQVW